LPLSRDKAARIKMTDLIWLKIDVDAPIVRGEGAAGLLLDRNVSGFEDRGGVRFPVERLKNPFVELKDHWVLRSDSVCVWLEGEIITQISVRSGYRGSVRGRLRLGDSVGKVASEIGLVGEDDEDNLACAGMPGMCFEIPDSLFADEGLTSYSREWLDRVRGGRICEISVFPARCDCGSDLRNRPDLAHCPGCGRIIFEVLDL
jgi:hypothetical protein